MAKAKKKDEGVVAGPDTAALMESVIAEVDREYGAGVVKSGEDVVNRKRHVIPFSPALDPILGGGIPEGSWVSVSGPEKAGKSVSLLSFAANCQRPEHGSRPVMVLATEHRTDAFLVNGIKGLKTEKPYFWLIESDKGVVLDAAAFLNIGLKFIKAIPGSVLLIDSISCLPNAKVLSDGIGSSDFGSGNRILSQFIDCATPVVRSNGNIILGITQRYSNTSGYGAKFNEKAAVRWKYQADCRLDVTKFDYEHGNGDDEPPTGQIQYWASKKSPLCGPGGKCQSYIRYGVGIDRTRELFEMGLSLGLISGKGWYTFDFMGDDAQKVQGAEKARRVLDENEDLLFLLEESVRGLLNPAPEEAAVES